MSPEPSSIRCFEVGRDVLAGMAPVNILLNTLRFVHAGGSEWKIKPDMIWFQYRQYPHPVALLSRDAARIAGL